MCLEAGTAANLPDPPARTQGRHPLKTCSTHGNILDLIRRWMRETLASEGIVIDELVS